MVAVREHGERTVEYARETLRGELPEEFSWVKRLTRSHLIQFAVELKDALAEMGISGDTTEVMELLDSWQATAELDADPADAADLLRPREEKEYVDWTAEH